MIVRRFLTPHLVIGVLLVAAVAVAGGFITNPLPIDTTVWNDFIVSRTPAMNTFMTAASWLFDPKRAVIVALAVAAFVWWLVKKVMHALYILGSVAFSGINGYIIKHIDSRPRPEEAYRLITEDGYSFPSGPGADDDAPGSSSALPAVGRRPRVHRLYLRDAPVPGCPLGDGRDWWLRCGTGLVDDLGAVHDRAERLEVVQVVVGAYLLLGAPGATAPGAPACAACGRIGWMRLF